MLTERATRGSTQVPRAKREEQGFVARRTETVERLVRAGIPREFAQAWMAIWDESTAGLRDFRAASDYWELAFQYALEERRRGYVPPGSQGRGKQGSLRARRGPSQGRRSSGLVP